MESIFNNANLIFGGVSALVAVIGLFFLKKPKKKPAVLLKENNSTSTNNIHITNNVSASSQAEKATEASIVEDERIKDKTRILFIDDNYKDYKMVSILKRAGWKNTNSVKDIVDLDDSRVLESDIVFVDINGVGRTMFVDQGLGLASALKNRHRNKKIVIYSAETSGDRFHKALREVDDCLAKNAEPYQFITLVDSLAKELHI